jgi:hypothetical protein
MNLTTRQSNCLNGCLKKLKKPDLAKIIKYPYFLLIAKNNMGILIIFLTKISYPIVI